MLKTTKGHRALLPCSLNDIDSVANLCSNAASFYQSTPVVQRQFFAFGAGVEASAQQFVQGLRAGGRRSLQTKASSPWALTSQNAPSLHVFTQQKIWIHGTMQFADSMA